MDTDTCTNKDAVSKIVKKTNKANLVKIYFEDSIVCFVWTSLIQRLIIIEIQSLSLRWVFVKIIDIFKEKHDHRRFGLITT